MSVPVPATEPQPIPATIATLVNVIGVFALAIGLPKPGPVTLSLITSTGKHFHLTTAGTVQELRAFAARHANRCAEILGKVEIEPAPGGLIAAYAGGEELYYRIDNPAPELQPEGDDVGELVELARATVGDYCLIVLDRFIEADGLDEQLSFNPPIPRGDGPWIHPDQICELIDALTAIRRTWLEVTAADEAA